MIWGDKESIVPDDIQRMWDGFQEEATSMQHPEEKGNQTKTKQKSESTRKMEIDKIVTLKGNKE